jgi:hypothetical protein
MDGNQDRPCYEAADKGQQGQHLEVAEEKIGIEAGVVENGEVLNVEEGLDPREPRGWEDGTAFLREEAGEDCSRGVHPGTFVPQDPEDGQADGSVDGDGNECGDQRHERRRVFGAGKVKLAQGSARAIITSRADAIVVALADGSHDVLRVASADRTETTLHVKRHAIKYLSC